jgi:site-specific recombinase XerD
MRGVFEKVPGSGVWWINFYDQNGKRRREKIGRYTVAVEAYLQRRQEVREGKFTPSRTIQRLTFRELVDAALDHKKGRLAPRSYEADRWLGDVLCKSLGTLPVQGVTSSVIEGTLRALKDRELTGSTVNRYRTFLSSVFRFALLKGHVRENPCTKVPRYRENAPRVRFLLPEEETALRKKIRERCAEHEPELDLALYTGIRRGEQHSLIRESVNFEQGILTVTGKTGRRHVPMNSAARTALETLLRRAKGTHVTPRRNGLRDFSHWLEDCVKEAGIANFTWHDLRHTFA